MDPHRNRVTWATLAGLIILGCAAMIARPHLPETEVDGRNADVGTYQRIVGDLQAGESYYVAVGRALRERNYATREAFNWRTPLLMMSLARLGAASRPLLLILAAALCIGTVGVTIHERPLVKWIAIVAQAGVLATLAAPAAIYMSESWAGVLIGLSVICYLRDRRTAAVLLGLFALFVRELAAPYCVVCTLIAAYKRRWREVVMWMVGAGLYASYYAYHLLQVRQHQLPTDLPHPSSWLELGGLAALTGKVHFQFWLLLAPFWVTAVVLTFIVASCVDRRAPAHLRAMSAAYIAFFAVAGKPFDTYWGLIAWPAWALACGFGLQYVWDTIGSRLVTELRT